MAKSKWRPSECKGCGVPAGEETPISRNGWCPPCGLAAALVAAVQMADRSGPVWDAYREKVERDVKPRRRHGVGGRFEYDPPPTWTCPTCGAVYHVEGLLKVHCVTTHRD